MLASSANFPLLAELLAEQQRLDTPVARFSAGLDSSRGAPSIVAPQLIPLTAPNPGEQYAFEVDLDSCTGCKSCVAACHSLNGLDENETWRDVGLLVSSRRTQPFSQTVTTACHHCADPACLNGCPVLAYEKDPVTGIVRHLDDQCIGCSYCILKCPYDVPKFSERLGIVRKCDMCHSRLAAGEAPACAQACPTHAIRIVTVSTTLPGAASASERMSSLAASVSEWTENPPAYVRCSATDVTAPTFLPCAPDPSYTQPTTRYITTRELPDSLVAADAATLRPQPPHWPLVIMLTLLPAAVGCALSAAVLTAAPAEFVTYYVTNLSAAFAGAAPANVTYYVTLAASLLGATGLAASVFHLGQPLRAWRSFLGWRRSWLSREAMVFGAWFPVATAALLWPGLRFASAALGLIGLGCSVMIYVDTRRHFWRASQTVPRFFGTAALVAIAGAAPFVAALLLVIKLAWESRTYWDGSISARLQRGPLAAVANTRDALGLVAIVWLLVAPNVFVFLPLLAGELAERYLFFRAVDAPKMPGLPAEGSAQAGMRAA